MGSWQQSVSDVGYRASLLQLQTLKMGCDAGGGTKKKAKTDADQPLTIPLDMESEEAALLSAMLVRAFNLRKPSMLSSVLCTLLCRLMNAITFGVVFQTREPKTPLSLALGG